MNEKLAAELAEVKTRGSSDAEAFARVKQQAAELSEDLEAANRELEVVHLATTYLCQHQPIKKGSMPAMVQGHRPVAHSKPLMHGI